VERPIDIDLPPQAFPDPATVTPAGERLDPLIDGVVTRRAVVQSDQRGTVSEIFNPAWGFTDEPLVYVYQVSIYPGQKKGWVVHHDQDDRLFFDNGALKLVLYDAREDSTTKGMVNELFAGTANRMLVRIPAGVVHAVANVGVGEARFVNLPTRPYNHERPDKVRLPDDAVPYEL
jgi:dTDP-4-dehydrorhamnose 3,5-epimerase